MNCPPSENPTRHAGIEPVNFGYTIIYVGDVAAIYVGDVAASLEFFGRAFGLETRF
jgi:hypothetical protein